MDVQILEGIFSSIQHPNFFNGRVLTATDLDQERTANLLRSRYLGQGLGEGVVYGLNVTKRDDVSLSLSLDISSGLAINRQGDVLNLKDDTFVELKLPRQNASDEEGIFGPYNPKTQLNGFYLLAITSAIQSSAKRTPIGISTGGQASFTHQYEEVGVQFKLISLDEVFTPSSNEPKLFRNRLAMLCFGIGTWKEYLSDKVIGTKGTDLASILRQLDEPPLTDSDVPLAVLHIQEKKIVFVDLWAVRRPCMPGMNVDVPADVEEPDQKRTGSTWLNDIFTSLVSPRDSIESAAFLLQFQHHLEDIRKESNDLSTVEANTFFEYLPAGGFLPFKSVEKFFPSQLIINRNDLTESTLDSEILRRLISESFLAAPIKLDEDKIELYDTPWEDKSYLLFLRHSSSLHLSLIQDALIEDTLGNAPADYRQGNNRPRIDLRSAINALLRGELPVKEAETLTTVGYNLSPFALLDQNGDIWLFWCSTSSGQSNIWCKYKPVAKNWEDVPAIQVTQVTKDGWNYSPFALLDQKGDSWLFWCSSLTGKSNIWYKYKPVAKNWEDVPAIQVTTCDSIVSLFALLDQKGDSWLFWASISTDKLNIWYKYKPVAKKWEDVPAIQVTKDGWNYSPFALLDQKGDSWLFWRSTSGGQSNIWYKYKPVAKNWEDEPAIQVAKDNYSDSHFALLDQKGDSWLFWASISTDKSNISYKHKPVAKNWEDVSAIQLTTDDQSSFPFALLDQNGDIWLFWTSRSSDKSNIWYKHKPVAKNWEDVPAIQVTTDDQSSSSFALLDQNGDIWLFWTSRSSGKSNIWCRSILRQI